MNNSITTLALISENQSYMEGAEDGFWRGYVEGAEACRQFIMGESKTNPQAPPDFSPLGYRWFDHNFAEEK